MRRCWPRKEQHLLSVTASRDLNQQNKTYMAKQSLEIRITQILYCAYNIKIIRSYFSVIVFEHSQLHKGRWNIKKKLGFVLMSLPRGSSLEALRTIWLFEKKSTAQTESSHITGSNGMMYTPSNCQLWTVEIQRSPYKGITEGFVLFWQALQSLL